MKLFVYGTLKEDGPLFLFEHAKNIREASIKGKMYAFDRAWFPFCSVGAEGVVHGEVHEYEDHIVLNTIDRIERGYQRVQTQTLEGEDVWVYHQPHIDDRMFEIKSGIWENKR